MFFNDPALDLKHALCNFSALNRIAMNNVSPQQNTSKYGVFFYWGKDEVCDENP